MYSVSGSPIKQSFTTATIVSTIKRRDFSLPARNRSHGGLP